MQEANTAEEQAITQDTQWVIFELNSQLYGFSIDLVHEMVLLPHIARVPHTPHYILGVVNLRDTTLAVMDLRTRLGMKSKEECQLELSTNLEKRKQEHIDWVEELKASVKENREFNKPTDPHKCKFGLWYDQYKSDDLTMSALLKKFDEPHKTIHGIAERVKKLEKDGKIEEAEAVIAETEGSELKLMLSLFDSVTLLLREKVRNIMIIAALDGKSIGLIVDKVESVLTLGPHEINPSPEIGSEGSSDAVLGVATPKALEKMVLLLDPYKLVTAEVLNISIAGHNQDRSF